MDVAKKTFEAAVVFDGEHYSQALLRQVPTASFARTKEGVGLFLAWLDALLLSRDEAQAQVRVVMESTGRYSLTLARWLVKLRGALRSAIVNPGMTSSFIKSLGLRNKTDRIEARALAFYGTERRPAPYDWPTPSRLNLRTLCRYRDDLIDDRVAWENRLEECSSTLIQKMAKQRVRGIERDIEKIEGEIRKVIENDAELKRDAELLESIPGVGFVTASVVLAELGDLRRFEEARQVSAFAGVSPRLRQSGTSVNGKSRMCKYGNPRVRKALYMAAISAMHHCPSMQACHKRLARAGKAKMVSVGTVMRKLLVLMRAVLIAEKPYDPNHRHGGKPCGKLEIVCG
jgi:transposase